MLECRAVSSAACLQLRSSIPHNHSLSASAACYSMASDGGSPPPPLALSAAWPLLRRYFARHLQMLPAAYSSQDCNRATIAHFALCGLDVATREMGETLPDELCARVKRWLYAQQVTGGFRGGPFASASPAASGDDTRSSSVAHLASTYSALVSLLTAGDRQLQFVARPGILRHIRSLQRADGSVACMDHEDAEADLRFAYCAAACLRLLGDNSLSHLDVDRLERHVLACQSYEGGFGLTEGAEAHGGATYVAVATLHLAGRLQSALAPGGQRSRRLVHWCVARQGEGYTGRANKTVDSCYAFWLGATMMMIQQQQHTDSEDNLTALMACFDMQRGGFGKEAEFMPDIMHSYLAHWAPPSCNNTTHTTHHSTATTAARAAASSRQPAAIIVVVVCALSSSAALRRGPRSADVTCSERAV